MSIPRKRFGQHFLRDRTIIERLVNVIDPLPTQHLVEIGPGQGALTFPVLAKSQTLDVIEIDRDLIPGLKSHSENKGHLIIHEADALSFPFDHLVKNHEPLRVIGNLPYNISTPLIFHLLTFSHFIQDMHFMLQKEVVMRLAAKKEEDAYGRLSIMVQYYCDVTALFDVPPNAFFPPPEVNSQIVRLVPYKKIPHAANNIVHFSALVKQAFSQRRKTLRNSLKSMVTTEDWIKAKIDSQKRPEELDLIDYVTLSNQLTKRNDD
jgi:16S rRNA (adenine1518-N6/adenine1519-N6)-dimethyltransferase